MKDPNSRPIEVSKPCGSNQICAVCRSPSANKKVANLSKTPWELNIPRGKTQHKTLDLFFNSTKANDI